MIKSLQLVVAMDLSVSLRWKYLIETLAAGSPFNPCLKRFVKALMGGSPLYNYCICQFLL